MSKFIQSYGSFLMAFIIAVLTIGYWKGILEGTVKEQSAAIVFLKDSLKEAQKEGTPFARDIRKDLTHHMENGAEVSRKADKALELLGNQRETLAELRQQVAYLVQVCGRQERSHVYAPYKEHAQPAVADSR